MKKQIGICALIAVLVLVAVGCASFTTATEYITNIAFVTAVERRNVINWTKEEDGTVPLTPENLKAIRAIRELDISDMELTDLSGIEWFSKLAILDCSGNRLTELDLSQNSNLWILWCNSNQLRSLDLSHNTALVGLDCSTNRLTDLDVSHNTALVALDCSSNHLTKLDVSNNIELDGLGCTNNQLSELDVSQNTALEVLYCGSNQLSGLDVSQNTALTELYCYENQLRSLDVSHNPKLYCGGQKTSDGEVQQLTLTLTAEQREIWDRYWANARYDNANNYDVTIEERNSGAENHPDTATDTTAEYITNIAFITAVEEATDIDWTKEEDGTVRLTPENLKAIRAVTELDLSYMELTDLSGIEWFSGLEVLDCTSNYLRSLDLSYNTKLEILWCEENQVRNLDLSHNTALEELGCGGNQLTSLDMSHNTKLEFLSCYENQLSELDVSQNTALEDLICKNNQLSELDLSQNLALTVLDCSKNQLTELDISHNPTLEELWCFENQLRSLDVSQNTALEKLYCGGQKTSDGKVQELTLTLTAEQREEWVWYWADETYEDANNYDVTIEE